MARKKKIKNNWSVKCPECGRFMEMREWQPHITADFHYTDNLVGTVVWRCYQWISSTRHDIFVRQERHWKPEDRYAEKGWRKV